MRRRITEITLLLLLSAATCTYQEIVWEDTIKLDWADFNHKPAHDHYAALTASGIAYSYTAMPTGYEIEVYAVFDREESWVNIAQASAALLAHEQLHFDITELWTRKLRRALAHTSYVDDTVLDELYREHLQGLVRMQRLYDGETHHSLEQQNQQDWVDGVAQELAKLGAYQDAMIYKPKPMMVKR